MFFLGDYNVMEVIINTVIQPIFKLDNSYIYKYNNNFVEISNIDLVDFLQKELSNSSLSCEELAKKLCENFDFSFEEASELIADLINSGFLTETVKKNRYYTNSLFFSLFDNKNKKVFQSNLENSEICVLGLGGSTLIIQQLAQLGIGKITGVDFDTLEESNLNRQVIFREKDVGNLKTDVLEKSLKEINSDLQYDFKNIYVDSSEKIRDIISTADIVILALDEPIIDSSLWVYNECKLQKKKIISGGVWGDNITYTYFDYSIDNQPCYQCLLDEDLNRDEITRTYIENVRGKHFSNFNTTTIFTGSVLAGIITTEITKILTSYSTPLPSGTTLTLNTSTWELNIQNIIVKKLCLSCEKEY